MVEANKNEADKQAENNQESMSEELRKKQEETDQIRLEYE